MFLIERVHNFDDELTDIYEWLKNRYEQIYNPLPALERDVI